MPAWGSIDLVPGVNTQKTLSANQSGVSQSQALRYKDGMIQALGGWSQYVPFTYSPYVRDLHPWQDAAGVDHLSLAATGSLNILTNGSNSVVTPQTATTNFTPSFSITSGSCSITVVDSNSSGLPSSFNTVFFNTQISLGGQILSGSYKIISILSSISYTIYAANVSSATVSSGGTLPKFATSSGSGIITVTFPANGYVSQVGTFYPFIAPTSAGGLTIQGPYQVQTIIDSTAFTIHSPTQATTTVSSVTMNSSLAQLVYYVTGGTGTANTGFGAGGFGSGGFGGIGGASSGATGTPITATDWTQDNWGEILLACPENGPIYTWSPDSGFTTASIISQAPAFNGGIFISMPQQILVAWRSTQSTGTQDNLRVRWSDAGDYTNWVVSNQTTAGSFQIPTGSKIIGGIQVAQQGVIWTDVDVWVMQYIGGDLVFGFNRVGSGCGLIGSHAAGTLNGNVYWMGFNNIFVMNDKGVNPLPCSVWDFVFQNLTATTTNWYKIRCAPNSAFNEISWFFPSAASTGENDAYVKYNVVEGEWDYGYVPRTAWCDQSILGPPIGTDTVVNVYQHEVGNATVGVSNPSFRSGWWAISEGEEYAFVDFVVVDFKWGTYSGAQGANVTLTFLSADYADGPVRTYGPYTVTSATEYITPRIRGRLMAVQMQGDGLTFWRIGRVRYRWAPAGRR